MNVSGYSRLGGGGGNTTGAYNFDNSITQRTGDGFVPAGSLGHSWAAFMMGPTPRIFHDNFRLSSRLTVNLGLRAEFENGVTERYNRMIGTFDPALALPIATAAQAAYAQSPVPELAAGNFVVRAGVTYPGVIGADTRRLWDVHRFHQRADRSAECCIAATRSVPHTR